MIVLDASAAVAALLNDGECRRYMDGILIAPHLIDVEVLHTMRRMTFHGEIEGERAQRAISDWMQQGVSRIAMEDLITRMWELRHNLTAYDASYVALAEARKCPIITTDARMARASGKRCSVTLLVD